MPCLVHPNPWGWQKHPGGPFESQVQGVARLPATQGSDAQLTAERQQREERGHNLYFTLALPQLFVSPHHVSFQLQHVFPENEALGPRK